ncbi:hypothetical protein [Mycolicibacterium goodii]|uniref:hypothetical protein n=1 Tax=Mycolicibacterium goodii TaxID=134601 RepID=UPI001BDD9756|nr:hypothetical protein [Mycolicibacterium goodii]MBU8830854.1 hypothetical protein [Mycolicibacterium goodii]
MSVKIHCDRCPAIEQGRDEFQRLDYVGRSIGTYHTIHLCKACNKALDKFLKGDKQS